MGFFDFLSTRKALPVAALQANEDELRAAFLALNHPTAPFVVREGGAEDADLVAEWRILDPRWSGIFARAGLERGAQVLLRLDAQAGEVRSVQRDFSVEWRAGLPELDFSPEAFRGQTAEMGFGAGFAFREEDRRFGRVHEYRFETRELKAPLREVTAIHGWAWRSVAFGRL